MYIDPNTGGMLFQILAVAFGAISAMVLFFSGQIRMFWRRMRRGKGAEAEEMEQTDEAEPKPKPEE